MHDPIEERVSSLPFRPKRALRQMWTDLFGSPPSPKLRRDFMIPILAHRLQEQAFGTIKAESRARLKQMARTLTPGLNSSFEIDTHLRPGTRLVRQWGDRVHLVNVESFGYEYEGVQYKSLSKIARLITGTRWSGPLFFGIKVKKDQRASAKESK